MNRRVVSVLIAGFVCLLSVASPGLTASAGTTAKPGSAVAVVKGNAAVRTSAVRAAALMSETVAVASGISPKVLHLAVSALSCAVNSGDIAAPRTLTVIDYSLPSVEPRLWVFGVATGELLFKELVAHGRNTGDNMATRFSDTLNSRQSSIGLFVARDTYVGSNGYSLRLDGLEPGFNSRARERAIVMHGAPYVDASLAATQGRIGRSWGCPALREAVARNVIDTVRGGGVIFSYYPDERWLSTSRFLNCGQSATA